jgi:hypothetical protein
MQLTCADALGFSLTIILFNTIAISSDRSGKLDVGGGFFFRRTNENRNCRNYLARAHHLFQIYF